MSVPATLLGFTADWWSVIATSLGAFGTFTAVVVALGLSRKQITDSRKRGERSQAEKITAWLDYSAPVAQNDQCKRYVALVVRNASDQLVYDLIAQVVRAGHSDDSITHTADEAREFGALIGTVRPSETNSRINDGGGGMHARFTVEISFRDSAGRFWVRRGDGVLKEISDEPLDRYSIDRPVSWEND